MATTARKRVQVTLERNPKPLKSSVRFDASAENALIANVYVRKEAFEGEPPQRVTLTLEAA